MAGSIFHLTSSPNCTFPLWWSETLAFESFIWLFMNNMTKFEF